MKKLLVLLTLVLFSLASFSQPTHDSAFTKDYFLKKSRNQKRAAWALLIGGTTMGVIGIANSDIIDQGSASSSNNSWDNQSNGIDGADLLVVGGIVADLTSAVFFVGSAKNKRKAEATLSLHTQPVLLPGHNSFVVSRQPALALKVGL